MRCTCASSGLSHGRCVRCSVLLRDCAKCPECDASHRRGAPVPTPKHRHVASSLFLGHRVLHGQATMLWVPCRCCDCVSSPIRCHLPGEGATFYSNNSKGTSNTIANS